jgi:protein gp37
MANRLVLMGNPRYTNGFQLTLHEDLVDEPRKWAKPRRIFVNSMSDLFHEDVPAAFIARVFATMVACPQHTFQILTKRSDRLAAMATDLPWPKNVWMGVSVEDQRVVQRVHDLSTLPAHVRFLSCEPLIGPLTDLPLANIHWVIAGGESGPKARPLDLAWPRALRDQCRAAGVAFFMKQLGGKTGKRNKLEDLPADLRIREFPAALLRKAA